MFRSLRWKISLAYLALLVLSLAALGLYLVYTLERLQLGRLQEDLRGDAVLAEQAFGPLLARGDEEALRRLLAENDRRSATRIVVTDTDGRLVGSTEAEDNAHLGEPVTLPGVQTALAGAAGQAIQPGGVDRAHEVVYLAEPVYYEGRPVGVIRLAYQFGDIDRTVRNLYLTVGSGIAGVGLLAVLTGFAIAGTISRPLQRLRGATLDLAAGRRTGPLPVNARDEVGALTTAFNQMAERLRALEDLRRDFLADVSHEIQTLASAMAMASEALAQGARADPATYRRLLGGLSDHIDRLNRLADDLIQLSRLERGVLELRDAPIFLDTVAEQAGAQFLAEAERRGIDLRLETAERVPIEGDAVRLGQVAANLLSNALKFTPRGGRVTVRTAAADGRAVLEVADTGIGIDPQDLPHIFDRYYRGGEAPRARPGMGLGLAIARGIARAERGDIEVESAPGRGSCFRLVLPLRATPKEAVHP